MKRTFLIEIVYDDTLYDDAQEVLDDLAEMLAYQGRNKYSGFTGIQIQKAELVDAETV